MADTTQVQQVTSEPRVGSNGESHADTKEQSPDLQPDLAASFDEIFQDTRGGGWSRGFRWGRTAFAILFIAAVIVGIAWGAGFFNSADAQAGPQETHTVAPTTFIVEVVEQGQLESSANVHLRSDISGMATITSIVPDGTEVSEGDVVIEFDRSEFETRVSEQEVKVRQARSTVAEKTTELEVAEITLEEYVNGTFAKELKEAEVAISLAEEELQRADEYLQYSKKLNSLGYITNAQLHADEFAVEKAQLELSKATVTRDALANFTYHKQVKEKEGAIEKAKATLSQAEEILAVEESRLSQLQESLDRCTIRAPQSGMAVYASDYYRSMSEGGIGPGAQVWQSQTVVWIPDLTQMQVAVNVHEAHIRNIHEKMKATVKVQGQEYEGEVVSVGNQPDQMAMRYGSSVKKYETIVKILGRPENLKPGLTAEVTIETQTVEKALTLPLVSVFAEGGEQFCYVKKGDQFERRKIICGEQNVFEIHVLQGLSAGDVVLHNSGEMHAREKKSLQEGNARTESAE